MVALVVPVEVDKVVVLVVVLVVYESEVVNVLAPYTGSTQVDDALAAQAAGVPSAAIVPHACGDQAIPLQSPVNVYGQLPAW